jgi:hypothetical protein
MVSAVYDDAQVISSRGLVVIVDRAPRAAISSIHDAPSNATIYTFLVDPTVSFFVLK